MGCQNSKCGRTMVFGDIADLDIEFLEIQDDLQNQHNKLQTIRNRLEMAEMLANKIQSEYNVKGKIFVLKRII